MSRQAVIALETERHDPSLDLAYRIAKVRTGGTGVPVLEGSW